MPSGERVQEEALRLIKALQRAKFSDATPLKRKFEGLTNDSGLYAILSDENEILYVGMANSYLSRFRNGHQALTALFIDGRTAEAMRIFTLPLRGRWLDYMLKLEKQVIFALQPPYNTRIPSVQEISAMQTQSPAQPTSGQIKDILKYLPGNVVDAIEDYADSHGMSDMQVLELAISGFLNLESVNFEGVGQLESVGAMKERIAILETVIQKNGLNVPGVSKSE
jgi:hypothetical protein